MRRARFQIDQEALRAYFPTDKSVQFTLKLAERLYGITFVERKVPVWHEDVRYFDVFERWRGKRRAWRSERTRRARSSAASTLICIRAKASTTMRRRSRCGGGSTLAKRTPISVLVTNFNRQGLDHDELETLLHEFGHVLHGVLSKTRYADQSGTSVKRDFVEAPSQMFEEWARREEAFKSVRRGVSGMPAPDECADRAAGFGAQVRPGHSLRAAARVRGV